MKKYVFALSVVLCTMMFGMANAQEKPKEQEKAKEQQKQEMPKVTAKIQTGVVQSIDATKNEIVIKDDAGAEVHLLIVPSTKITKQDKTIALGDVKVGDVVTGECEPSGDGCKAKSISVTPAPPSQ